MRERAVRRLFIVAEDGRPLGILTVDDLIALREPNSIMAQQIREWGMVRSDSRARLRGTRARDSDRRETRGERQPGVSRRVRCEVLIVHGRASCGGDQRQLVRAREGLDARLLPPRGVRSGSGCDHASSTGSRLRV